MTQFPEEQQRARSSTLDNGAGSRRERANSQAAPGVIEQGLALLTKRKWAILQAVAVVTLLAVVLTSRQDTEYTASAKLLFQDQSPLLETAAGAPLDARSVDRAAATNEALATLPEVADRAASRVGQGVAGPEVQDAVNVESEGDSDLVTIEATFTSPKLAASIADAYGEAYIAARRRSDQQQIRKSLRLLKQSLAALSPADRRGTTGADLKPRIERLRVAEKLQTGRAEVVSRASVPTDPSAPSWKRNIALALVVGTMFGFFLASLLERLDRRIKEPEDLEEIYGVPILASIPRRRGLRRGRRSDPRKFYSAALGEEAEPFRTLRSNLRFARDGEELSSLLVVSPSSGDGKSTVARALAVTMASMGDSVVLIDADLRKPDPHSLPGVPPDEVGGLSTVLEGGLDLTEALTEVPVSTDPVTGESRSLVELASGPERERALELLESDRMGAVMDELERRFETVIIDSPALLAFSDALTLVTYASATLVVTGLGETRTQQAADSAKRLSVAGASLIGAVANYWEPDRDDAYYGYQRPRVRLLR